MLILTRKAEQGIVIDHVTIVRILSIDGDRVKIGIDAPTSIPVLREELLNQTTGVPRDQAGPGDSAQGGRQFTAADRRRAPNQNGNGAASGANVVPEPPRNVTPG